ncbi:putative bifunctional diguanylate cyclase/phosphodiesterase [Thiohalophilus thiocyanatoxydans]|uniref:Diguanylate cyclase (GGDEF)-like protein n=1 Tax=Thiohalophilus thiocyanatoxydans TaxID=381308 RepID=A0A4R8IDV2_9GAMM|nr:EAL domain-containing protein [Thiohalophilus thiocyanatoxydans]TDX97764.1 diguanylate cyclase (GGDEF)-like protein [Thiohalophilus thiocyanatoxydans]
MILKYITMSLIVVGLVLLLASLQPVRKICQEKECTDLTWNFIFILLLLFIAGYISQLIMLSRQSVPGLAEVLVTAVFSGGSLFVLLITRSSLSSIEYIRRISALELHYAYHDQLTGLPNRNFLYEKVDGLIKENDRQHFEFAVLMMDLNQFKEINDSMGHQAGDKLIQYVAVRIKKILRVTDTFVRLGGDEFAVLLPGADEKTANTVARSIVQFMREPFQVDRRQIPIGLSIGVARYPDDGASADILIQHADVAMYQAKDSGTGYAVYDASADQYTTDRLSMLCNLRDALDNHEITLYYQPIVDLGRGKVWGVEALARWRHAELGMVMPSEFIPLAVQSNQMRLLSQYVLHAAIQQMAQWRDDNIELRMSVNLTVYDIQDVLLPDKLRSLIERYRINPARLVLEITESSVMTDSHSVRVVIEQLHEMGVTLAIDDFGTGYSSLAYLKQIPADEIKIDKSFVRDMTRDDNDAVIVRTTIDLAHNMGRQVIAEGVEDREAYDLLEILRCDLAQGYYICKPLPEPELRQWLARTRSGDTITWPFTSPA